MGANFNLIETSRDENCPKLAIVSCVVNATQLQPYVFRNYEHPVGGDSHYRGSTQYKAWQAIQASAAAPGYFQEVISSGVLLAFKIACVTLSRVNPLNIVFDFQHYVL